MKSIPTPTIPLILVTQASIEEVLTACLPHYSVHHPDIHICMPLPGKASIGIEQIHAIGPVISVAPLQAPYTTIAITPADALTIAAQQALLKPLEECPAYVQFLLVTPRPLELLATIRSRARIDSTSGLSLDQETLAFGPLQTLSVAACVEQAAHYASSKDVALSTLNTMLRSLAAQPTALSYASAILAAHRRISANVTPRLVMERLLFYIAGHIPSFP